MLKFSKRTIIAILLLLISVYLLMDQPGILITDIFEGFPAGTLISWTGIFCLTVVINDITVLGVEKAKMLYAIYRRLLGINLILAMFWGLLGFYLSGNWSMIFFDKPEESVIFWYYTIVITSMPLLILIIYIIHKFIDITQQKKSKP